MGQSGNSPLVLTLVFAFVVSKSTSSPLFAFLMRNLHFINAETGLSKVFCNLYYKTATARSLAFAHSQLWQRQLLTESLPGGQPAVRSFTHRQCAPRWSP
jgi:hypothetical protein